MLLVLTVCLCQHVGDLYCFDAAMTTELLGALCLTWRKALLLVSAISTPTGGVSKPASPAGQGRSQEQGQDAAGTSAQAGTINALAFIEDGADLVSWATLEEVLQCLDLATAHVLTHAQSVGWAAEAELREQVSPLVEWFQHYLC